MIRESSPQRLDWQRKLEEVGVDFHHMDGIRYWAEEVRYRFTSREVDEIDDATAELHRLCLAAVEHVVSKGLWEKLAIPAEFGAYISRVWRRGDPTLLGRFDLAYDGRNPPKLLEYNADTPTALLETAVAQWHWVQEVVKGADQFNSAHEKLIDAWKAIRDKLPPGATVHFSRFEDQPEDYATSEYLRDTCVQAGLATKALTVPEIGWNGLRFTDMQEMPIQVMHKLYPWEWMAREQFGRHVLTDTTAFIEPAWKMILSNKAVLPLLWELFPNHPNLLEAHFEPDPRPESRIVKKPVFSREGSNVELIGPGLGQKAGGTYGAEGFIYQKYHELPRFDGYHAVIGSWVVAGQPAGMCVREDSSPITHNASRFVPHYF
ncbi:MAG: glutathionylspermidine synthase family protein [Rhodospirillales bacterium]|nr:glutathionylspermidine synthase family protein [Rhodospirillales bacterium]